jgi:hypothetical protein
MDKLMFRNALLWVAALLVAGCAGITPYDPPDDRENPPGRGLLSGADGEFVIYQKADEADPDGEEKKNKEQKQP